MRTAKPDDNPEAFKTIGPSQLQSIQREGTCQCCGQPFTENMRPELTGRCHSGPVFASYWDGWLYLSCGTCRKPVGRIKTEDVA